MEPPWLPQTPERLSDDPDLRAVQRQWLWDTLYMRRILFCLALIALVLNLLLVAIGSRWALVTIPASGVGFVGAVVDRLARARRLTAADGKPQTG